MIVDKTTTISQQEKNNCGVVLNYDERGRSYTKQPAIWYHDI